MGAGDTFCSCLPMVSDCHFIFVRYEKLFGRLSDYNLCVTDAMKKDLLVNFKIK